jgi:hypothetical protein
MADNKTKPTKLSVGAYIDALTDETRRADARALVRLMQSAAGEKPQMWGPSSVDVRKPANDRHVKTGQRRLHAGHC